MDSSLDIDFYFGDCSNENIHLLSPKVLNGYRKTLENVFKGDKLVWQKGAVNSAIFTRNYKYYILTGNPGIKSNWVILIIARLLGRNVWLWTHGLRGNESGWSKFVNILYMRLSSGLLFYNERGAAIALKEGIDKTKIHVLYNSLDYQNQKVLRGKIGDSSFVRNYFGNDKPYVLFMGRLTSSKKIDIMLYALKNIECNVIVVGDGPQRENLENLVSELSLEDKVWFYGECYDESMNAQLIYNSVLLVSPGNIGLSAIHAMTYGTAAITHNDFNLQMPEFEAVSQLSDSIGRNLFFEKDNPQSLRSVATDIISYTIENRDYVREKCYSIIEGKWNSENQIKILKSIFGM